MLGAFVATLAELGWGQVAAIFLALVVASLLRAFTGFGFALAAVPALSLFLAPVDVVVLIASLTVAGNLVMLETFRRDYPPGRLAPLLVASLLGTALGARLLGTLSVPAFQLLIGVSVLIAGVVLTVYRPRAAPAKRRWGVAAGGLSGLMNGAFAIPGPPVVVFAMATERDPVRSRAMLLYFFLFSALIALGNYAWAGYVDGRSLQLFVLGLPAMLVGDQIGLRLFRRAGTRAYRRVALLVLYAIGASLLLRGALAGIAGATA